ncbi:MAG: class I SAM-dependent methyltransferase [Chitinophagaceae bacterium]|nr:MAG: class I SAM-dependent methyltransferase [Chitinophagaceae bacterium]
MSEKIYLKLKDHSVSGEDFQLIENKQLDLLETFPKPAPEKLPSYYASEDYISHTDAKRSLFEKVYHLVRSVALKSKLRLLSGIKNNDRKLLDIGAGTGDFLSEANKKGWATTGFEPDSAAQNIALSKGVHLVDDLDSLPNYSFDAITMWHVLEHVPDVNQQIRQLKRLLKPNGLLVIAVPNYKSYDASLYGEFWAAYDVPRHLTHFSKTSVSKLFDVHGMKLIRYKPMWFDAFYISLLSSQYKNGKSKLIGAFISGLRSNLKTLMDRKKCSSLIYIIEKA